MNKTFVDRFFRPVDNVVWDMMSGKVGYKTNDGIVTIELNGINEANTEADDCQVTINPFDDFGMELPAFAQSIPANSISLGDMIFSSSNNKVLGWVVKKSDKSFKLMKQDGTRSDWTPPKVQMLGFDSGVMVLRSLMNMLPGGQTGLGQMQSALMPMMAMGMLGGDGDNDGLDLKSMMPMLLMSQMGMGGADASATGNMMGNMMQMMMFSQLLKNKPSVTTSTKKNNFFD